MSFKSTKKIKAFLNLANTSIQIGEIAAHEKAIYFKYDEGFLEKGFEISPFNMKRTSEVITPKESWFEGLFGVFSDTVPDGWGRLLLDRKLISMGVSLTEISALDRLAYIGHNGMGAITYEPMHRNDNDSGPVDLDRIDQDVQTVLRGSSEDVIEDLFRIGGSSGGARPKILVGYHEGHNEIIYGAEVLPEGFEHWIIKFPSSYDWPDIALIEFLYNEMASKAGIEVAEYKLFTSNKGNTFFGSKRFDRIGNEKLHLHSAAGLLHDNFRASTLDYGHVMEAAFKLEEDYRAASKVLRLAAFNMLTCNRDDHSKNFSFLMDNSGKWKFAPAYDLTFSVPSHGHHSMTIAGEGKNPTMEHIDILTKSFGLKNTRPMLERVREAISGFSQLANSIGISKDSKKRISTEMAKY